MTVNVLQTIINDFIIKLLDRVNDMMYDFIWERGWDRRGNVLWDDMIPFALALGAVFSLFLVAKIAYKTMVLEEGIDFMKLWRPIAMSFVVANWYAITISIFSLTQPFETYFREGFETQNQKIIQLQHRRKAAVTKFDNYQREKAAIAYAGELQEISSYVRKEMEAVKNPETGQPQMSEDEMNDILISTFGESYMDMKDMPLDENGNPQEKFDTKEEIKIITGQNFLERCILWIAEMIWGCAVLVIFMVRAFFICVLVMFGPVYMVAAILPAWEDAWKQWIEKYVFACFLGTSAFLGLIFASHIIIWGVTNDVTNWEYFASSEQAWYEWIAHVIKVFCGSIGLYIVALLVGNGVIGASFELTTYFYPSSLIHGAESMFNGLWSSTQQMTSDTTKYAYKEGKKGVDKTVGGIQAKNIEKEEDKARESLNLAANMGPEGEMKHDKKTGEFEKRANTYQDHQNSSAVQANNGKFAAHRWADRMWQQKLAGMDDMERLNTKDRHIAAQQDLEEFFKAQQEGRAEEFMKEHAERMRENRILLSIASTKRVSLHHFGGDAMARDNFLRKHGMYDAFIRAEKLQAKAAGMHATKNIRKNMVHDAREGTSERIYDLIGAKARETLAARGITFDFNAFDEKDEAILLNEFNRRVKDRVNMDYDFQHGGKGKSVRISYGDIMDDGTIVTKNNEGLSNGYDGTYRIKAGDEGYENVREQMKEDWFRKMAVNSQNRAMLSQTIKAYEQALNEGRGEEFIRNMQLFGQTNQEWMNESKETFQPFAGVHMGEVEFYRMWGRLQDTDRLKKINDALEDIEKAYQKHRNDNLNA